MEENHFVVLVEVCPKDTVFITSSNIRKNYIYPMILTGMSYELLH